MSIKIEELLSLPSFRRAELIAGQSAKNNVVNSISVLESTDPAILNNVYFHHQCFRIDEVLIAGFINNVDNIDAQCDCIRGLFESGASGLIIFYVGIFLPEINGKLIDLADEIGFPIIKMPPQRLIFYGEAITDVMSVIIKDKEKNLIW
ncbi:PucR family transcriptional regulator ligand-binding domain-containing protein [Lachnospiraceae bacterium ZAX-1]